ncbi:oligosaccharide flippase family protein [Pontibacter sp. 172403-2]|uniref:oligosaccharide flippase family protein n=1 Tax=Pontibacter rufus TaxID=2791028 RepID=UPI0018B013E6|nr:oligosaccharide flippase family protein [Pontibacter sp. 172403-2]MBF9254966.1 oligosaccharide flippase family protein [Pontibacter sp. 172403-2]
MLLSPVIARIYSPAAFGSLTLFVSIITVVGSVSAAKYEMAIILPAKRLEGQLLAWVSVLLVACTTILSAAAILIFSSELSVHLNEGLYFIPLSIALLGLTNVLTYWHGRSKKYMLLSQSKVAQSVGNGTAQVGLSQLQGSYFNGLIVAYLLGQVLFVGVAGKKFFIQLWRFRHLLTKDAIRGILRKYRRFLSFYTPSALLDNASMQAPVFILSTYFSIASAGLFGLTYRIVNIPLSLISSAVGQVYYQKIAELKNEGQDLRPLVIDTAKKLFFLSIPPTVVLLFAGEFLFSYIFGEEWTASGHYAQVLAIPFAVRFIASPLSSVLVVNDKLKVLSLWQFFYFITTVSILYIGTFQPLTTFIYLYGINEVVQYLFYLFLIIKYSKR